MIKSKTKFAPLFVYFPNYLADNYGNASFIPATLKDRISP